MRHIEILSLLELLPDVAGAATLPARDDIRRYVLDTIRNHPGSAHPISDRWAVSIVPPAVVLLRIGATDRLAEYLLAITKWIADRYENGHLGLASPVAEPTEEAEYILGRGFPEGRRRDRRSESYVSTIVLDLAAVSRLDDAYRTARNEYLAVGALPCVLESDDNLSQYRTDDSSLRFEPNVPYRDELPENPLDTAPHYTRQLQDRYLQRVGRAWDLFAVSAFLRDRHFLSVIHSMRTPPETE